MLSALTHANVGSFALTEEHGDVAVHAERVDRHLFAADVYPR